MKPALNIVANNIHATRAVHSKQVARAPQLEAAQLTTQRIITKPLLTFRLSAAGFDEDMKDKYGGPFVLHYKP